MRAYHNSRELKFRTPFGAVALGGAVCVSIDTWDGEPEWAELRIRVENRSDDYFVMNREGGRFTFTFTPESPELYWYSFIFHFAGGGSCWYGPQPGRVGGVGQIYDGMCPEYQVTAYVPRKTPDWYKNAICYQIFPDRFYRGSDWRERAEAVLSQKRAGTPKALVEDWETPVRYKRLADGRIKVWEFYGGTLSGIRELPGALRAIRF